MYNYCQSRFDQIHQINKFIRLTSNIPTSMILIQEQPLQIFKENLLNYEKTMIENCSQTLPKPVIGPQSKYSICQLNKKINKLICNRQHNLRWIESYIYCLLMLTIHDNQILMQFKSAFYELCRKYLQIKQQQLVIKFLNLIQSSRDQLLLLTKYPSIEKIIYSVFDKFNHQQSSSTNMEIPSTQESKISSLGGKIGGGCESINLTKVQSYHMNRLTKLYTIFSKKFHFLQLKKSNDFSFQLSFGAYHAMYIIVEKQYLFVLQPLSPNQLIYLQQKQTISHSYKQQTSNKEIQMIEVSKPKLSSSDIISLQKILLFQEKQIKNQISLRSKPNLQSLNTSQKLRGLQNKNIKSPTKSKINTGCQSPKPEIFINRKNTQPLPQSTEKSRQNHKGNIFAKKSRTIQQSTQQLQTTRTKKQIQNAKMGERSFPQKKVLNQNMISQNDSNKTNNFEFYKPKMLLSSFPISPKFLTKNQLSTQKIHKHLSTKNDLTSFKITKQIVKIPKNQSEQQKSVGKNINLYSPIQSPSKKNIFFSSKNVLKKDFSQEKFHEIAVSQNRKQYVKLFDKKQRQKLINTEKKTNNKNLKSSQSSNSLSYEPKSSNSLSYQPKVTEISSSVQNKKDFDIIFKKYSQYSTEIKTAKKNQKQDTKIQAIQDIHKLKTQKSKSFSSNQDLQVKSKLQQNFGKNFHLQNFDIQKKQKKSTQKNSPRKYQVPKMVSSEYEKAPLIRNNQSPETIQVHYGQYQIRIKFPVDKNSAP